MLRFIALMSKIGGLRANLKCCTVKVKTCRRAKDARWCFDWRHDIWVKVWTFDAKKYTQCRVTRVRLSRVPAFVE